MEAEERKEERKNKLEAEERRAELETSKVKGALEERRLQVEFEEKKLRLEMEEKERVRRYKLECRECKVSEGDEDGQDNFRIASAVRLVPKFDEMAVENYFMSFEKAMEIHKFPKNKWTALLHSQLVGKAAKVFSELTLEDCKDYDKLKQAVLTAYARVPEYYRKRFRSLTKMSGETYSNFAFRLGLPLHSWLEGEEALTDVDRLLEVVKLEQFVNCLPLELHKWIVERKPKFLRQAATLADEYATLYKPFKLDTNFGTGGEEKSEGKDGPKLVGQAAKLTGTHGGFPRGYRSVVCGFCSRKGHTYGNCFQRQNMQVSGAQEGSNPYATHVGLVQKVSAVSAEMSVNQVFDSVHKDFRPYCFEGWVQGQDSSIHSVVMLRDSGALQSLVSKSLVPSQFYTDTGEFRLIKGIGNDVLRVSLVEMMLSGEFFTGTFLFGLIDSLPTGVHIIIGNDICCGISARGGSGHACSGGCG